MMQRFFAATLVLLAGLGLSSCASFSATVTDHWPTWAGGLPNDVPPRPGAPGYDEFMARQQGKGVAPTATASENTTTQPAPPSGAQPPGRQVAVPGSLY
jgi:hypothetical protein